MFLALLLVGLFSGAAMAIEEPVYEVVRHQDEFEVRDYKPYILAEVSVTGELDDATSQGFRILASYIFGKNHPKMPQDGQGAEKISMTAPVTVIQQPSSQKIEMTAPVTVIGEGPETYKVRFTMPKAYTMQSLPLPDDERVTLWEVPARRVAVREYSGTWSQDRYHEEKSILLEALRKAGLTPAGEPEFSRYNSPFSLWFLRRNEVWIPIER